MRYVKACVYTAMRSLVAFAVLLLANVYASKISAEETISSSSVETNVVEIQTAPDRTIRFNVELADTPAERQRGLMFRKSMPTESGMLFIFDGEHPREFWMRNTWIPLDILYFSAKGRLVSIQAQAQPYDETPLPSRAPARYVLEINGGLAAELGILPGATMRSDALEDQGLGLLDD